MGQILQTKVPKLKANLLQYKTQMMQRSVKRKQQFEMRIRVSNVSTHPILKSCLACQAAVGPTWEVAFGHVKA